MENLFSSIEFKLNEIDSKLTKKKEFISKSYESDVGRINSKFQTQNEIFYNQIINDYRDFLLNQTRTKLIKHIQKINDWTIDKQIDVINQSRDSLIYFKKGENLIDDLNELILSEYQMEHVLNLFQLDKYYDLIIKKKRIEADIHEESYIEYIQLGCHKFLCLPSNRVFICAETEHNKHRMYVIGQNGKILSKKDLNYEYEIFDNMFKSSNSKIFHLYQNFDEKFDNGYIMVSIHNFNLDLLHSIKLDKSFYMDIIINKHEFGFQNVYGKRIHIYKTYNYSSSLIELEKENRDSLFYVSSSIFTLVHFNREYLYFYGYDAIHILNRNNGFKIATIIADNFTYVGYSVIFDKYCNIYHFDKNNCFLSVHDLNGKFLFKINVKEKYKKLCFSYKNTFILNQNSKKNLIEYDEY